MKCGHTAPFDLQRKRTCGKLVCIWMVLLICLTACKSMEVETGFGIERNLKKFKCETLTVSGETNAVFDESYAQKVIDEVLLTLSPESKIEAEWEYSLYLAEAPSDDRRTVECAVSMKHGMVKYLEEYYKMSESGRKVMEELINPDILSYSEEYYFYVMDDGPYWEEDSLMEIKAQYLGSEGEDALYIASLLEDPDTIIEINCGFSFTVGDQIRPHNLYSYLRNGNRICLTGGEFYKKDEPIPQKIIEY